MGSGGKKSAPAQEAPQPVETPVTGELSTDKAISRVTQNRVETNTTPSLLDDENKKPDAAGNLLA